MSFLSSLQLMSQYNQWMNQKVYQTVGQLEPEELTGDRGAFFGSILGSLNHIYVADVIWLSRFAQHPQKYAALSTLPELPSDKLLDQTVANDLETMTIIRQKLDEIIINWCQELKSEELETNLNYHDTKGNLYRKNFGQLIYHFFNHQTHHRGQVTTLISQQGLDVGVTDLLKLLPEQ